MVSTNVKRGEFVFGPWSLFRKEVFLALLGSFLMKKYPSWSPVAKSQASPIQRKLLGAPGLTTRSKDATRSKGHRY